MFGNVAEAPGLATDVPVTLLNTATVGTGQIPGGASTTYGPFDISQYQTIHITFNHDIITAHTTVVSVLWQTSGGILIGGDKFSWTTTDGATLLAQLPARGDVMAVTVTEGAGVNTDSMILVGSYRPQTTPVSISDRILIAQTIPITAGNAANFVPIFRFDGACTVGIFAFTGAVAAANPLVVQIIDDVTGLIFSALRDPGVLDAGVSRNLNRLPIVAPRNTWHVNFFNSGAANITANCEVIASRE